MPDRGGECGVEGRACLAKGDPVVVSLIARLADVDVRQGNPGAVAAHEMTRSAQLDRDLGNPERLKRVADAWGQVNQATRDAEEYNLDRKPLVFAVFGCLAEAAR